MLRLNIPAMEYLLKKENSETIRWEALIDDTIESYKGLFRKAVPGDGAVGILHAYFLEIGIPALSALRTGGSLIRELNGHFTSLLEGAFAEISPSVLDEEELSGMVGTFDTAICGLSAFAETVPAAELFLGASLVCMRNLRYAADALLSSFLGFSEETEACYREAGTYIAEMRNIASTYSSVSLGQDETGTIYFLIGNGERYYDIDSLRQAFSRALGALGSHNGLFELECLKNAPSCAPISSSVRTITKKMTVGEASAFGLFAYGDDSVKEVLSRN
ncbi:MAG: hypothetical protein ABS879_05445, partial [Eubacteriales bacterium]